MVQLSHPYMTTGKTIALTRWTFVGKVMSLLFKMLSSLVIAFLLRSKRLLISWLQSPSAVLLEPKKIIQFSSGTQWCPTLCDPMDCSVPDLPVHHQLMSIESVMPSNHLILCHPLLLLPLVFPRIRVFPSLFFASGGQSIGVSASASVLPVNTQD